MTNYPALAQVMEHRKQALILNQEPSEYVLSRPEAEAVRLELVAMEIPWRQFSSELEAIHGRDLARPSFAPETVEELDGGLLFGVRLRLAE